MILAQDEHAAYKRIMLKETRLDTALSASNHLNQGDLHGREVVAPNAILAFLSPIRSPALCILRLLSVRL